MTPFDFEIEQTPEEKLLSGKVGTTILPDGAAEITFDATPKDEDKRIPTDALEHTANLAEFMSDEDLSDLSAYCESRYSDDVNSNREFNNIIAVGFKQLGMSIEELSEPFPGASPVSHPIILESAIKTQSKIMGEVFSGKGIVDAYISSKSTPEKLDRVSRVKKYMDYQYLCQMEEFIPETEKLALRYSLTGNAYRKYFFDARLNRLRSKFIPEDKFVINSNATTIRDADFYTEVIPVDEYEYESLVASGEIIDVFEGDSFGSVVTTENRASDIEAEITNQTGDTLGYLTGGTSRPDKITFLEHHVYRKLPNPFNDGEQIALPYVVTRELSTNKIVSVRRNWQEQDADRKKLVWHTHYSLIPGLGFHGLGYIHILGNFQFALTQIMRSLIDAGQFANLQAGFRAKGVRFTKDANVPLRLGEWREIETNGKAIAETLYQVPTREPSQVLHQMFNDLDIKAQKFADSAEQVIADSTNYGPVGTTIALLEASTKFFSGILKRFYHSLTEEFRILYRLNADMLDTDSEYYYKGSEFSISRMDFDPGIDVTPKADPNISSSSHRIALAQTKLSAAQQAPDIHNLREAYTEFYLSLGMEKEEVDRLLPPQEEAQPLDPLSDIIAVSSGKPIKAFEGQDHDAHIRFKKAFLEDPLGGASPEAGRIVPLVQANIAEHMLLRYMTRVKGAMVSSDANAGSELALAEAAELAAKVNTLQNNMDLMEAKDPAALLALAEQKNAATREEELQHKKNVDFLKLQAEQDKINLQKLKLAKDADLKELQMETNMVSKRMDIGADMVKDALKPSKNK